MKQKMPKENKMEQKAHKTKQTWSSFCFGKLPSGVGPTLEYGS